MATEPNLDKLTDKEVDELLGTVDAELPQTQETGVAVSFEMRDVPDRAATKKRGELVTKKTLHIIRKLEGHHNSDIHIEPINKFNRKRYEAEIAEFEARGRIGTSLDEMEMSNEVKAELESININSVEALARLDENVLGGRKHLTPYANAAKKAVRAAENRIATGNLVNEIAANPAALQAIADALRTNGVKLPPSSPEKPKPKPPAKGKKGAQKPAQAAQEGK